MTRFEHARALHRQGRLDEAARCYEQILSTEPTHLDALIYLGVLRLGQGHAGEAEGLLRRATTASHESPEAFGNLAAALQALGRYDEAVTHYEQALALRPDMLDARFGLAACLQAAGRHEEAIARYELILATDSAHPEANYGLAALLAQLGRSTEAAAKYRAALAADPDFAEASYGLGKLLMREDAAGDAVGRFLHALDVDPDYIEARAALAGALSQLERDEDAIAAFRAVLAAEPDHIDAHNGLGTLLVRQRYPAEAIEHYQAVLAHNPAHIDALAGMASALKNLGRHDEALAIARRLVELRPDFAPALGLLGTVLAEMGSLDEAIALLRRAVELAPHRPQFAYHLVSLAKVRPGEPAVDALQTTLASEASLPPGDRCLLHFALAKVYDDIGERDRGFEHLLRGNAIKRGQTQYDEAGLLAGIDMIARRFTGDLLADRNDIGDPSPVPVFIVGMPRSGTTLVEQILASHPSAFGAGERLELPRAIRQVSTGRPDLPAFPHVIRFLDDDALRRIGATYVAALRPLAPEAARIIDKLPANFLYVGLIRLILPNARIIHVQRDPVDTCLSCFSKIFFGEQPFAYDLAELGRYYAAYHRLMAHWRAVVSPEVMLEVEYEALVDDFEPQARRIVAHCGLEWDPRCLEFYKTDRPVQTASMAQVRQPIYRSSVGRWRPDPRLLQPLLAELSGLR